MKLIYEQAPNRFFPFYWEKLKLKDVSGLHPCYLQKGMISICLYVLLLWWWNKCTFIGTYVYILKSYIRKRNYTEVLSQNLPYEFCLLIRKVITIFHFFSLFLLLSLCLLSRPMTLRFSTWLHTTFPQRLRKAIYMMEVSPQ